ncbi:MAG: hypothetical protein ABIP30_13905 [Ferruginibacter sp.]
MKRTFYLMMLFSGISGALYAQGNTAADKIFQAPMENVERRFLIELGQENKMQIELANINDLEYIRNIDSLLQVFRNDMEPFKDSLADNISSKRVDYIIDTAGKKKIRIQQFYTKGSSFYINNGDVSLLKSEQDTIHISGMIPYEKKESHHRITKSIRYYHVTFYINRISEMATYMDGRLNEKIKSIQNNMKAQKKDAVRDQQWQSIAGWRVALKTDKTITAKKPEGYIVKPGAFISLWASVNIENYKNYFVPSVSLGPHFTFNNTYYKREVELLWEPTFFFSSNGIGKLKTYRNDFLTLTFAQGFIKDNDPLKTTNMSAVLSFGYLLNRSGNYFDKNTFRLGAGRLLLFDGKLGIEPSIYFNNFFKAVTPSIKFELGF